MEEIKETKGEVTDVTTTEIEGTGTSEQEERGHFGLGTIMIGAAIGGFGLWAISKIVKRRKDKKEADYIESFEDDACLDHDEIVGKYQESIPFEGDTPKEDSKKN